MLRDAIDTLRSENKSLREREVTLSAENKRLRERRSRGRKMKDKLRYNNLVAQSLSLLTPRDTNDSTPRQRRNSRAAQKARSAPGPTRSRRTNPNRTSRKRKSSPCTVEMGTHSYDDVSESQDGESCPSSPAIVRDSPHRSICDSDLIDAGFMPEPELEGFHSRGDGDKKTKKMKNNRARERKAFKYKEVIRGKEARSKLPARKCAQCEAFYAAVGIKKEDAQDLCDICSRHRSRFAPKETPDGYWNLSLPGDRGSQSQATMSVKVGRLG